MTPIEFPAAVGGWPQIVIAEQIESIERHDYYQEHCVLVLSGKRRIGAGCSQSQAAQMIRLAATKESASDHLSWAVQKWRDEVAYRPLVNVHRRSLDDTWRQVIRHFGGDPVALCGPAHDDLWAAAHVAPAEKPDHGADGGAA